MSIPLVEDESEGSVQQTGRSQYEPEHAESPTPERRGSPTPGPAESANEAQQDDQEDEEQRDSEDTFYQLMSIQIDQPIGSMSISPANRDVALGSRTGLFIVDLQNPYDPPRFLPHASAWEVSDVQVCHCSIALPENAP